MIAVCSPIERPVRGSAFFGISSGIDGRSLVSALSRSPVERALLTSVRTARMSSETAMGGSEVVSVPAAMPESIWPSWILLATRIVVSRPVPQAWPTS